MKRLIFIFFLTVSSPTLGQPVSYEQIAFEHFFKNIFRKEYEGVNTIQFSGQLESESSNFGILKICFDNDIELYKKIEEAAKKTDLKVSPEVDNNAISQIINFKKRKVKNNLRLNIFKSTNVENLHYVELSITKINRQWGVYFFEMNDNGEVKRWCKTGLIY